MRSRVITMALVSAMFLAAMWGAVARAQAADDHNQVDVAGFQMKPLSTTPHSYPPTQAGGNPDMGLYFRFCDPGNEITDIVLDDPDNTPAPGPFIVTTATPHGMHGDIHGREDPRCIQACYARPRGRRPVVFGCNNGDRRHRPLRFRIHTRFTRQSRQCVRNPRVRPDRLERRRRCGCTVEQYGSKLAAFKLELPPGVLGNPTALETCPTFLWIAKSCPDRSLLGYSVTETVIVESANASHSRSAIQSPLYNVATLGLEPARLGTTLFPSEPAGPFPIKIDLRTEGDYGLDSALVDIPKNLGGPVASIIQIETVLCAQVPCKATNSDDPTSVAAVGADAALLPQPDFVQGRHCQALGEVVGGQPRNEIPHQQLQADGLRNVPFDPAVSVTPPSRDGRRRRRRALTR